MPIKPEQARNAGREMIGFVHAQITTELANITDAVAAAAGDQPFLVIGTLIGVAEELRNAADNLDAALRAFKAAGGK